MSIKRHALSSALKTAHREETRAASLFTSIATNVKHAQLHGKLLQFGSQGEGRVLAVEALLDARGISHPLTISATRVRAAIQGCAAHLRPWRRVVEDALDLTERRARLIAGAASNARLAGDIDAARNLDSLRENAGAQANWMREYLQ
jgi:hypothetical protein